MCTNTRSEALDDKNDFMVDADARKMLIVWGKYKQGWVAVRRTEGASFKRLA